ncbi:MAG: SUMF1/EgtB/PvdO family nonheme iron enzyme [Proteobacteria bacterium]|nr:SUMF1/EgtB/PvdO family nonheme iron enzyme [Pseudomonadota bacterium]
MGRVLEALDPQLRRTVAIKVALNSSELADARLGRFVAEAQITGQLEHPNIVPVHDLGITDQGQVYFVMKRVQGRSLRELLASLTRTEGRSPEWTRTRLLHTFIQVCNAVAYAHSRGVLHRDIKPDNVMLGAFGEVLLLDWGIARMGGGQDGGVRTNTGEHFQVDKTVEGAILGTPGYMSPEQAQGRLQKLDFRSDVWSLGALLYEVLTLRRAYRGRSAASMLFAVVSEPPPDPREESPERRVPDEIAEICLQAMATQPDDRFENAGKLGAAVEAFLEGSKRREAAEQHLVEARSAWGRYEGLSAERQRLRERQRELDCEVPAWAPLSAKAELLQTRSTIQQLRRERVDCFEEVIFACDQALSQDPDSEPVRSFLAEVHYRRFEEAEAAGDSEEGQHHRRRVERYDRGDFAARLGGTGALSLRTEPAGAEVFCERFEQQGLVWQRVEQRSLGRTPLDSVPLEQGSYLLTLRSAGKRDTCYPIWLPRGHHWDSGPEPLPLFSDAEIGEDFLYIPAGPFVCGGDPEAMLPSEARSLWLDGYFLARFPVTLLQWCEFLNSLAIEDPEQAWQRVPRAEGNLGDQGNTGQYWDRPAAGEPYRIPEQDRQGDPWDPTWAVLGIDAYDADAYAAWCSTRDHLSYELPRELQWEKAARGVDGRVFPWGNTFDATLCKMQESQAERPMPTPNGSCASDCSVYGVRDLAGNFREWCGDPEFDGNPKRRPVRGGSWYTISRDCRAASRSGSIPWNVCAHYSFRLARPLPASKSSDR